MANTITTVYPINEPYNFLALIQITGDGTGDITGGVLIDPANLTGTPSKFSIEVINTELNGFTANLYWDATTPLLACALTNYDGLVDFKASGQALHNYAGAGINGKMTISTQGLTNNCAGTLIIKGYHR